MFILNIPVIPVFYSTNILDFFFNRIPDDASHFPEKNSGYIRAKFNICLKKPNRNPGFFVQYSRIKTARYLVLKIRTYPDQSGRSGLHHL